ncbi:hypothetical protein M2282_002269 [Variovorax boronicumulans]|uniref:HNH endonuclease n=1 Tax=Variovorax boronicumulans TaxID=436515 RepID=UPI00247467BC|nr:HNH endonuclease [Variovorax boronicumulans]MDH6167120.1 hypothetical protein [Variovorax boronicumulans]
MRALSQWTEGFTLSNTEQGPSGPSQRVAKRLFALSGNRCAFPKCGVQLVQEATILGEISHIKAASPNGPRYDPNQAPADRHDFDNLLLLCANHHKVVDDDEISYTVERLLIMKRSHESAIQPLTDDDASAGAKLFLSIGQSGGLVAGTVHAQTINIHAADRSRAGHFAGDTALALFVPELARLLARQVYVLDRAVANFICSSAGQPPPSDHWTTFRPWKPLLYRSAAQTRDLAPADAALLAEFFESLAEIDDLVMGWQEGATVWDVNVWNFLMQKIERSVVAGLRAAERFCPDRQYDTTMPASGTLRARAEVSASNVRAALDAHIRRYTANATNARLTRQ